MPPDLPDIYQQLLSPDIRSAMATAGMLLHWIASDPARLRAFGDAMEGCPGALPNELIAAHLAAVHAVIEPGCRFPADQFPENPHAHTH